MGKGKAVTERKDFFAILQKLDAQATISGAGMIPWLGAEPGFPPDERALREPNGLLAAGGALTPAWLLAAYRRGSELLKHCQQQLSDAEPKIQVFENGTLRDFETTDGETR